MDEATEERWRALPLLVYSRRAFLMAARKSSRVENGRCGDRAASCASAAPPHGDWPDGRRAKEALIERGRLLPGRPLGLYVVADGMGGHAAGEVASQEAVETVYGMVKRGIGELHELVEPLSRGRRARRLPADGERRSRRRRTWSSRWPRSTAARRAWARPSAPCSSSETTPITAQVGDSRIYRIREGAMRAAHRGSHAHRLAAEAGAHHPAGGREIAAPQRHHPRRRQPRVRPGRHARRARSTGGDRFLLCSDGLHGYLHDAGHRAHRRAGRRRRRSSGSSTSRTSAAARTTSRRSWSRSTERRADSAASSPLRRLRATSGRAPCTCYLIGGPRGTALCGRGGWHAARGTQDTRPLARVCGFSREFVGPARGSVG